MKKITRAIITAACGMKMTRALTKAAWSNECGGGLRQWQRVHGSRRGIYPIYVSSQKPHKQKPSLMP